MERRCVVAETIGMDKYRLKGCVVVADATNCQSENTRIVIEGGGDYAFNLKKNHPKFCDEIDKMCDYESKTEFNKVKSKTLTTLEKGHGRVETRHYRLVTDDEYINYFNNKGKWWKLAGIGIVDRTRIKKGKTETERHYFVTSLNDVKTFADAVRRYWSIENNLHWTLDVTFQEDAHRARTEFQPHNCAMLRHIALNLLKLETSVKDSFAGKRFRAAIDDAYMLKILRLATLK